MRGLFVTGTDTNVGKTVVSAGLLHRYQDEIAGLRYWKPIQTGIEQDDDTRTVQALTGTQSVECEGVRLHRPVSPHLAARLSGRRIDLAPLAAIAHRHERQGSLLVEGAGGALVPINDRQLMADLIRLLDLPALVVSRASLGTINHTLLTIAALRARDIAVAGVVMVGDPNRDNREAIEEYGAVAVIGELPPLAPLTPAALAAWAASDLDRDGALRPYL